MNRAHSALLVSIVLAFHAACDPAGASKPAERKPASSPAAAAPTVAVVSVLSQQLHRELRLPGELQPYQDVSLYPKVQGFIEWIGVDRGSVVKTGQLLVRLTAPEIDAQRNEAEAKVGGARAQQLEAAARVTSVRSQRAEAEARLAASTATYKRLKSAAETPGVVSGNELENAQRLVEAEQARVEVYRDNERAALAQVNAIREDEGAARAAARSVQATKDYLRIAAPFDGVITERNAHTGSLVGPSGAAAEPPMLRLQELSRLRLVVPVPESEVAGIIPGANVTFSVSAFPAETFRGTIARIGRSIDAKTRTMPVELDVNNADQRLAPGMLPIASWPTHRPGPSLFVPPSAVAVTTERTFVVRIRNGIAEWVDVTRGASIRENGADMVEVFGELTSGDEVVLRGTDELRAGTRVQIHAAPHTLGRDSY